MRSLLLREQILTMFKRLELDGVARRVEEKHGGLFARFAFEADVWLDDEFARRIELGASAGIKIVAVQPCKRAASATACA